MKRGGKTLLCLLGIVALTPVVWASINDSATPTPSPADTGGTSGDEPYSSIWVRNVFDLKPPAPPPSTTPPAPPPSNVKLVGITTIFGPPRALLSVQDPQVPGQAPKKEECLYMIEGERQHGIEVLEINPKARTAKIKNEENISTIALETNKPAGGPATAPQNMAGGGPRPPGFGQPGGFNPPPAPLNYGGGTPLPPRTMRPSAPPDFSQAPQGGYSPQNYASGYATGYPQGSAAGLSLPNAFTQAQSPQQNNTPEPSVPLEVSALQLEAQRLQAAQKNLPFPPPPPPLAIPDELSGGGSSTSPTQNNVPPPPPIPSWAGPKTTQHQ